MASLAVGDLTINEEMDISLDENQHYLNDYLGAMTRLNNDRRRVFEQLRPFFLNANINQRTFLDRYGVPWNEWADGEINVHGITYIVIWNAEQCMNDEGELDYDHENHDCEVVGYLIDKNTNMEVGEIYRDNDGHLEIRDEQGTFNAIAHFENPTPQPPQIPQEILSLKEQLNAIDAKNNRLKNKIRLYYPRMVEQMEEDERGERTRYYQNQPHPANPNEAKGGRRNEKNGKRRKSRRRKTRGKRKKSKRRKTRGKRVKRRKTRRRKR